MESVSTANVLYDGWELGAVRERNDSHDAVSVPAALSSGFTAVNWQQTQLLTPRSSATAPVKQNQARRTATGTAKRLRNPTVAQYLGLGASSGPEHLEKYAPLPDEPGSPRPKPVPKRRKLIEVGSTVDHVNTGAGNKNAPRQRRVSEGLRGTKPPGKPAARSKTRASEATQLHDASPAIDTGTYPTDSNKPSHSPGHESHHLAHNITVKRVRVNSAGYSSQGSVTATSNNLMPDTQQIDQNTNNCVTNDSDQFDWPQFQSSESIFGDEEFNNDLDNDKFPGLTSDMIDTGGSINVLPSMPFKSGIAQPDHVNEAWGLSADIPVVLEVDASNSQRSPKKFVSPVTLTTRLFAATGDLGSAEARKPIVRPPFPVAVRDRSPIIGLTSKTLLRTCFRIGEAVNQAHQASKFGKQVIFELYARILDSERDDTSQHFTFCDLFHAKPPYIKAVYDGALWRSVQLFNYDSARLLQQGRICRCMGKMKREDREWVMTVLNIWEATWDDVRWVEGVVSS